MMRGLLQQQPGLGYSTPRSAASPQHGQKTHPKPEPPPAREPRGFTPRHNSHQQ